MAFDVQGARNEGYSEEEIAQHLAQENKFNYADAKKEGYSDAEIIAHMMPQQAAPQTADRTIGDVAGGAVGAIGGLGLGRTLQGGIREDWPHLFRNAPVSPPPSAAVSNIPNITVTGSPATAVPAVDPTARIMQGGIDEASGTTGRARQVGYNERTAQQAAQKAQMDKIQEALVKKGVITGESPFAASQAMSATPSGISAPKEAVEHFTKQTAADLDRKMQLESRIKAAEQTMQQRAANAAAAKQAVPPSTAGKVGDVLKSVNEKIGHFVHGATVPRVANWGFNALAGLGAGAQAVDTVQRIQDPNQGWIRPLVSGLGAIGSGAAMTRIPAAIPIGMAVGTAAPFVNEYLDEWAAKHPEAARRLHLADGGAVQPTHDQLMQMLRAARLARATGLK